MLLNPYTPGGRPRVFVGRERERSEIRDRLARVIAFGEMAGPLSIVTGPRGLGKTSLLRDIADQAASDGFVVAWVAGVKRQPLLPELAARVRSALERAEVLTTPHARARFTELALRLNIGIGSVETKFAPVRSDGAHAGQLDVEELLHEASQAVRARGGAGLLILIDELHAPLDARTSSDPAPDPAALRDIGMLLNAVQNMEAERERFPLAVVGAGLPQTMGLLTRAATFGERTNEIVLEELDAPTSQAVLVEPARQLDVGWSDEAIAVAVGRADGYPHALQVIGSAAWEAARPEASSRIEVGDVERGWPKAEQQMASMFRARWEAATAYERRMLRAMAEIGGDAVLRRDVAQRMGVASADMSVARASLISKGIIEAAGYGRLRFTIPGFGEFVLARGDD